MKAMILAAGQAERLRPLTHNVPKPMLVIAGRPILEHNVRLLVGHGIRDIIINLHHCPDVIRAYFKDGSEFSAHIRYSWEPTLLGTAGALKPVAAEFDETFLVLYGDNLTNCDLSKFVAFHRRHGGVATVAVFHRDDVTASGIVELNEEDRVMRFLEKPLASEVFSHWVNAGILALESCVLNSIPEGVSDFGRNVLPCLARSERGVYGYRMSEQLWWIDSPTDYERTLRGVDESAFFFDHRVG